MGVPTRTSGTRQSLRSSWSPTCRLHRAKAPASASSTLWARSTGRVSRLRAQAHGAQHGEVAVEPGHVDREAHADRVHRPGRARAAARRRSPSRPEQPLAPGGRARRPPPATPAPPRPGATTASREATRCGRAAAGQTLKRISRTSPSCDHVVLALDAELADVLGLVPRAELEQLVPVDHLGPDEARARSRRGSRPAHCGRLVAGAERPRPRLLLAGGEEGAQAEQLVGGVEEARQRALAEARAPRASRPARSASSCAASASSCTHMPITSARPASSSRDRRDHRLDVVELVLADVDDGHHRPVGEEEVRPEQRPVVVRQVGAVDRRARLEDGLGLRRARPPRRRSDLSPLAALRRLLDLVLDRLEVGVGELELDDAEVLERVGRARARRRRRRPAARTRWRRPRGCG